MTSVFGQMSDSDDMNKQIIQVRYPDEKLQSGKLVLFTSLDGWKKAHRPIRRSPGLFVFSVKSELPFFHFKPCIVKKSGEVCWSQGSNYLAPLPVDRLIFPYFQCQGQGVIQDRQSLSADDGEEYGYRVYLPPGYEENTERSYPLCLMHDGHNLFFPHEAFAGQTWQVRETLEHLDKMNSIEACIVVALYPNDRMKDYMEPGAARYADFLVNTMLPHIEKNYRTLRGPDHRLVMGSSLGGLISFYLAWHHHEVFGRAACLSSTFSEGKDLFEEVRSGKHPHIKLYLDSGWPGDNFAVTQAMAHTLLANGFELGRDLHYLAVPEAQHTESAWAQRLHLPFQLLLGLSYGPDPTIDCPMAA